MWDVGWEDGVEGVFSLCLRYLPCPLLRSEPRLWSMSAVAGYSGGLLGRRALFWIEGKKGEASQGNTSKGTQVR